jgi:hypothetical protein
MCSPDIERKEVLLAKKGLASTGGNTANRVLRSDVGVNFRQCRIPMLGSPVRSLFEP